ncbi:phosphopantetheine-binding protein [Brevibacillus laterosporus]|uniref:Phosphopantetheine attachment site family protein n=1 Tax=Brevibacillus laterosporus TaxID=1465 RepID=A0AAP8U582_BRELA|nr:phosphopantetheine-binding protein [Brevibacillus laterosporus]ATO49915.1 phosphopantetheine attachment site family protein [Brevibacillus laterosporus DSM 25]AYB39889.1 phosphopantetheine attachment site family protein [Brevibacillus laterosporus]MBG9802764.1 phosphopantetheine attachment site family protein [Brevibacillus laterosporus]MBM7111427.1 Aminoacyl carrier protein [Brevibacillus laterosporus]MED1666681.1 phosphopantetheine-binding protein [Brevibacillus laterosporus]
MTEATIRTILQDMLEIKEPIAECDDLTKMGLDSMTTIRLIVALEQAFDLEFSEEDLLLANFRTLEKITGLINERQSEQVVYTEKSEC